MAKKNNKRKQASDKKKRPTSRHAEPPQTPLFAGSPDIFSTDSETAYSKSLAVLSEAADGVTAREIEQLVARALEVCPDCVDAHILAAQMASSRIAALTHLREAVAAGERLAGAEAFRKHVGHFWGLHETRPYMYARFELAQFLWSDCEREEAIAHLEAMLVLNPNDNQGVRYSLLGWLLFLDRDDDAVRLLDRYPDESSVFWAYTRALLAFRKHGDTDESRKLLKLAIKCNRYVPKYLMGQERSSAEEMDFYSPGSRNEAIIYLQGFQAVWKDTAGAIGWLREQAANKKPKQRASTTTAALKKLLSEKPQTPDVWLVDARPLPTWIQTDERPIRPSLILVVGEENAVALGHHISQSTADAEELWATIANTIRKPMVGSPRRPAVIRVPSGPRWEALRGDLNELGIRLEPLPGSTCLDQLYEMLSSGLGGEPRPGILDGEGITPDQVRGFYDACAAFYRQKPWRRIGYESAIRVECNQVSGPPWFAVLMGQAGLNAGLSLYNDYAQLAKMFAEEPDAEHEAAEQSEGLAVLFGESWEIATQDLDTALAQSWSVARSDAYPDAFRKMPGRNLRPPTSWELRLMEGCLRAAPEFVTRRKQNDATREQFTVSAWEGPLKLTLSWVVDK